MSTIKILIKKEINNSFNTWGIYSGFLLFFCVNGFFTWLSNNNVFYMGQASMSFVFENINWIQFFIIPAFTMRSFAEERRNKTLELILTKPIRTSELIIAKFLACFSLTVAMIILTIPYYITIANLGNLDLGAVLLGYLGLLLMAACHICIGLYASSLAQSPVAAFFIHLGIGIFFQFLFGMLADQLTNDVSCNILSYLSMDEHFQTLLRGILDTRDIIYFGSILICFLFLTKFRIERERY